MSWTFDTGIYNSNGWKLIFLPMSNNLLIHRSFFEQISIPTFLPFLFFQDASQLLALIEPEPHLFSLVTSLFIMFYSFKSFIPPGNQYSCEMIYSIFFYSFQSTFFHLFILSSCLFFPWHVPTYKLFLYVTVIHRFCHNRVCAHSSYLPLVWPIPLTI